MGIPGNGTGRAESANARRSIGAFLVHKPPDRPSSRGFEKSPLSWPTCSAAFGLLSQPGCECVRERRGKRKWSRKRRARAGRISGVRFRERVCVERERERERGAFVKYGPGACGSFVVVDKARRIHPSNVEQLRPIESPLAGQILEVEQSHSLREHRAQKVFNFNSRPFPSSSLIINPGHLLISQSFPL